MLHLAPLAEVDALPCSCVELSIGEGDGYAGSKEPGLCMGRAIVWTFVRVFPFDLTLVRNNVIHGHGHVGADCRIVILVE